VLNPGLLEQLLRAEHSGGGAQEGSEDAELLGGEVDVMSVSGDRAS
jgi:hypothetical protein